MRIIGVDPGAMGALALHVDGKLVLVADMPALKIRRGKTDKNEVDGYSLAALITDWKADIAYVEQVGGLPGQSASAAFNFGRACGAVEYTLKALGVRVEMVSPMIWKKALKINGGKDGSKAAAMRIWPRQAEWFKRQKDVDRAEAALVAEWGFQQQKKGSYDNVFS